MEATEETAAPPDRLWLTAAGALLVAHLVGMALAGVGGLLCAVGDNALGIPVVVIGPCLLALACNTNRASHVLLLGVVFGGAEAALAFSAVRRPRRQMQREHKRNNQNNPHQHAQQHTQ